MTYPGGKNGAGIYQRIINYMPPHSTYVEGFLGSGAVLRNKRPAARNIGIDPCSKAITLCRKLANGRDDVEYYTGNAISLLSTFSPLNLPPDTLIYCDPPYLPSTRKAGRLYAYELSELDHLSLLKVLTRTKFKVMVSGYRSALYDDWLQDWHRVDYQAQTRRGMAPECLWMNFAPPVVLHDYSHLGSDYRERERIKKKKARFAAKFDKMDRLERLAIMDVLTRAAQLPN